MTKHDWLLEVLCDVEAYAIANELDWLVPLINKANVTAGCELKGSIQAPTVQSNADRVAMWHSRGKTNLD